MSLTDKTSGALLCDFDTKCAWCDRFIAVAVHWNAFPHIKHFIGPTIVLAFGFLARRALVAFNANT